MSFSKTQGYTLLELIVVIGLMGLLVTVMVIDGVESRRIQYINNAAQQLESAITEAQAYGKSGKAFPPGSTADGDFDRGYGVYVTTQSSGDANKKIIIYGGGIGGASPVTDKYNSSRMYKEPIQLEGDVEVTSIVFGPTCAINNGNQGHMLFRRGQSEASIYGNASQTDVCITIGTGSVSKIVHLNNAGLLYIE